MPKNRKADRHQTKENARTCWCFTINNPRPTDMIDPELVAYMIVGHEIAPDTGTAHIQGYCRLKTKIRHATMVALLPRAHITAANGSDWQNHVYCPKDKEFTEWGKIPKEPKEKDTTYAEALDAPTVEEGITLVKSKRPRDYCLYGETIERNLKRHKKAPFRSKYKLGDFNRGPLCLDKATLICGETRTGKSHFAASHFNNPLFVRHIDKLSSLCSDHDGIIFDDMSFKHWPPEAIIHLLDEEFDSDINIRYKTAFIPAHTRKIFTHNDENPFYKSDTSLEQQLAIERRLNRVVVYGKLY